jgi:cytoskeletal protein CcmA (bactofilin family)
MASETTVIGRGTIVRARVFGTGDLEVQGRVEGEIATEGEVIVAAEGLVGASVTARRIVVRGAVRGDLVAEEGVHLEDGARVVGDVRSSRVSIAPGALLRGYVQTGAAGAARPARAATVAVKAAPKPAARAVAAPAPKATPKPAPKVAAAAPKAAPKPAARPAPPPPRSAPAAAKKAPLALAGARPKAPPPVVPVLKKGAKGSLKKKA